MQQDIQASKFSQHSVLLSHARQLGPQSRHHSRDRLYRYHFHHFAAARLVVQQSSIANIASIIHHTRGIFNHGPAEDIFIRPFEDDPTRDKDIFTSVAEVLSLAIG